MPMNCSAEMFAAIREEPIAHQGSRRFCFSFLRARHPQTYRDDQDGVGDEDYVIDRV
jgi:hypothetical protein